MQQSTSLCLHRFLMHKRENSMANCSTEGVVMKLGHYIWVGHPGHNVLGIKGLEHENVDCSFGSITIWLPEPHFFFFHL